MTENLGRKLTLIFVLLAIAIASMIVPMIGGEPPFRLGLDLRGGTRLVYRFDFEEAIRQGKISTAEYGARADMLQAFTTIIHSRVDPQGVMELTIRPEGDDRIVIELPGAAELATTEVAGKLAQPLGAADKTLTIEAVDQAVVKAFPVTGGVVRIGQEKIEYARRDGPNLLDARRGAENTAAVEHAAGDEVDLLSNDDLQKRIENVGDLQFLLQAGPQDFQRSNTDQTTESQKVETWRRENPGVPIESFNRLTFEQGGPPPSIRWYPEKLKSDAPEIPIDQRQLVALTVPKEEWVFTGDHLSAAYLTSDDSGYPAVGFEFEAERKGAFGDFTEAHIGDGLAIVLNGEVATVATIQSKLPGSGHISGGAAGFTPKEVQELITVLRSGSLRIKPQLLDKSRVGASLGEDYVATGALSSAVSFLVVVAFMTFIYRRLGWFSVIGLLVNLVLLMGTLAFLRAALSLPGIAGIVLTVGMAVDGNILIFERLREELNRGLKLVQAARAAFERASVTIIDSNLTTLIAGAILYYFGTGPIRGFATTLCVGIATTLFTVIVVTQVLIFADIKRGRTSYRMLDLIKGQNIRFLDWAKPAIAVALVVIVSTNALFISLPNQEKLGIDFLGGFTMTVRTEEPRQVSELRELVGQIPGTIGRSAEVKEILETGSKESGYTGFRIMYKLSGDETDAQGDSGSETGEGEIRDALASVLTKDPIRAEVVPAADAAAVSGELRFEDAHPTEDLAATLGEAGLREVKVDPVEGQTGWYRFEGQTDSGRDAGTVLAAIRGRIEGRADSRGTPYSVLSPVPESSLVGAAVGAELRDAAIKAMLLALAATVLYLRVRFAEYSYGIAVVVTLVHDVLVTLGAIAVANWSGLLQAEVDLSMIAAFLTIIGYSQNDTIVIFDRVRENLPRMKKPLKEVLNDSINQTLGRTILTSSTVFLTIVVLFLFNLGTRNVLEGFSFALIIGVISGTFSTVYIAAPVLMWFENRRQPKDGGGGSAKPAKEEKLAVG